MKHIEVHHYFMGLDRKREIPFEEAVTHWYDTIFFACKSRSSAKGTFSRSFQDERTLISIYGS